MLLVLLPLLLQESAAGSAPPAAPAAAAAQDPAARALVWELARRQHAECERREVFAFDVQLNLRERGEQVNEVDLGLNYTRKQGEILKLSLYDRVRGTRVEKGFDGRAYWLREEDQPPRDLSAHEFAEDRAAIDDALELAADLLLVLDLGALARSAEDLQLKTDEAGARSLVGRVLRGGKAWEFALALPPADAPEALLPVALDLIQRDPESAEAAETEETAERPILQHRRFLLEKYKAFAGRSVPQVISEVDPAAEDPVEGTRRILELRSLQWEQRPLPPVEGALEVGER